MERRRVIEAVRLLPRDGRIGKIGIPRSLRHPNDWAVHPAGIGTGAAVWRGSGNTAGEERGLDIEIGVGILIHRSIIDIEQALVHRKIGERNRDAVVLAQAKTTCRSTV